MPDVIQQQNMFLPTEIAEEFLEKYKLLMKLLNGGVCPNGVKEYAPLRGVIYEKLNEIEELYSGDIGSEFVNSLKRGVLGKFVYLKPYKDGYAMYSLEKDLYYLCFALTTPLEEYVQEYSIMTTAIVPFQGFIVCDGLIVHHNVSLGKNMAKEYRDGYWHARKSGQLIKVV
jgi:hypothetical protein